MSVVSDAIYRDDDIIICVSASGSIPDVRSRRTPYLPSEVSCIGVIIEKFS
jgi:hypothetical protein